MAQLKHGSFRPGRDESRAGHDSWNRDRQSGCEIGLQHFVSISLRSRSDRLSSELRYLPRGSARGQLEIVLNVIAPEPPFLSTRKHSAIGQFSTCSCVSGT